MPRRSASPPIRLASVFHRSASSHRCCSRYAEARFERPERRVVRLPRLASDVDRAGQGSNRVIEVSLQHVRASQLAERLLQIHAGAAALVPLDGALKRVAGSIEIPQPRVTERRVRQSRRIHGIRVEIAERQHAVEELDGIVVTVAKQTAHSEIVQRCAVAETVAALLRHRRRLLEHRVGVLPPIETKEDLAAKHVGVEQDIHRVGGPGQSAGLLERPSASIQTPFRQVQLAAQLRLLARSPANAAPALAAPGSDGEQPPSAPDETDGSHPGAA